MVLVAVGEHHRAEAVAALAEVREVGDDVVHPGHLVVGEEEAAVHGDDVVARLDQHHVEPDLAETAQRNQAHGGLNGSVDRNGLGSVESAHGGAAILPPRLAGAKKRAAPSAARSIPLSYRAVSVLELPLVPAHGCSACAGSRTHRSVVLLRRLPKLSE